MQPWFRPWGWIYRPTSAPGVILVVMAALFCWTVIQAADRHAHSVSDFLYAIFPYVVCCLVLLNWLASKTSAPNTPRL